MEQGKVENTLAEIVTVYLSDHDLPEVIWNDTF